MTASASREFDHVSLTMWNLVFHYAQTAFMILSGIMLTPLFLRHIPEKTYGVWLATGNLVAWLTLVDPGLNAVIQQRLAVAYARGETPLVSRLRTQCYVLSALIAVTIGGVGLAVAPAVASFVGRMQCELPGEVMKAYYWAVFAAAMMTASYGAAAVTIGMQSPISGGLLFLLSQAANAVIVVVLLGAGQGLVSIPIGLLAQAVVLVVGHVGYSAWRFTSEGIRPVLSAAGTMAILEDSRGMIMSRLAAALLQNTDMLLAAAFLGPVHAVAVNMTQKAPLMLRLFIDRISHSAMPSLSAIHAGGDGRRFPRSASVLLRAVVWVAIPAAVGAWLFNRTFIGLWIGDQYYAGDAAMCIIAVGLIAMGLEVTLSNLATSFGLFRGNGQAQLVKSFLTVLLGVLMTRSLGVGGLLAAPLVAGACTTWWLLPLLISRACVWRWSDWLQLAAESARALVVAVLAGGLSWLTLRAELSWFLVAGGIYAIACLSLMAVVVPSFRRLLSRLIVGGMLPVHVRSGKQP